MSTEPDNLVLHLLREMREEMATKSDIAALRAEMATKQELAELRSEVTMKLTDTRKELGEQIVGLRRAVVEYHSAVVGHGILISDLEARLRRVEQHLNLSSDH